MAIDDINPTGTQQVAEENQTPTEAETKQPEQAAPVTEPTAEVAPVSEVAAVAEPSGEGSSEGSDFGAMLDHYEEQANSIQEGEVVTGRVIAVTEQGVLIDIGFKSEGIVPKDEFLTDESGNLMVQRGDEVDVLVKNFENSEGYVVLSRADAVRMKVWDKIRKAHADRETITGKVIERIKGGLKVDIDGVAAFLPGSQVAVRPVRHLDAFKGKDIQVRVIKINKKRSNIVLSRKVVLEEEITEKKGGTLSVLEEGAVMEGQVKNITEYGAFIDLGGVDGLLHITDMSWGRILSPNDLFKVGDKVQIKILKFDKDRERISLGFKQLLPDPWETVQERYYVGQRLSGKIVSITDYGSFVELEEGVEGLVHVTEMTWSKRLKHPSKIVDVSQEVNVMVLDVDPRNRRISLGIKQTEPDPWETLPHRYGIGTRVEGKVRSLTDFGAFVEIEDGVDGLVHVSDISWTKRIKHPSEVLKKGQAVNAIITNIDSENRRLSLSIKDLEPNAWDRFFDTHRAGDLVKGKIARFANFGAFVELEEGIEGLCHVSELADERIEKPEDAVQIGQQLAFKILKLDREQRKIGLSARAVGKEDDPSDVRTYYDSGEGMASLGELANLFPRSAAPEAAAGEDGSSESGEAEAAVEASAEVSAGETVEETVVEADAEAPVAEAVEAAVEEAVETPVEAEVEVVEEAVEAPAAEAAEESVAEAVEADVEDAVATPAEAEVEVVEEAVEAPAAEAAEESVAESGAESDESSSSDETKVE
ncbi:MAG: 30S ribosomal protein S1 [Blastocatellia bacterium]|nr:30S ribosomal protein S1 [Blastocatellia bacterium]